MYGIENFYIEQLDIAKNQEELNHKEVYYGELLNVLAPHGYSLKLGNGKGHISEESLKRMCIASKKVHENKETICKNRASQKNRKPIYCYQTGKVYSSLGETLQELNLKSSNGTKSVLSGKSGSYMGYTFDYAKDVNLNSVNIEPKKLTKKDKQIAVFCEQNGKTYESMANACRDLGLKDFSKISMVLSGKYKSYMGYTFRLAKDVDYSNFDIKLKNRSNADRKVSVFCEQNGVVYDSVAEAARELKLKDYSTIFKVLDGRLNSYGGYSFKLAKNVNLSNIQLKERFRTNEDRKIPIKCNETGQEFESIKDATRKMGFGNKTGIQRVVSGKAKSYKGFTFSYL
jgi:hypothetical protein